MPGPVVNGVRQAGAIESVEHEAKPQTMLPLIAEGHIRLLLLSSGDLLMARLRDTTDRDGDAAYQLIRPLLVCLEKQGCEEDQLPNWSLQPFLSGLTPQQNLVIFKSAVASVMEPEARLLQAYALETRQECPLEQTPLERFKLAFREFTEAFEASKHAGSV